MTTETDSPTVETAKVEGRRDVRFSSLDEILADADGLVQSGYRRVGNWSLGQICKHLAVAMEAGIDGSDASAPWPIRWVASRFYKPKALKKMSAGFKLPKKAAARMVPGATDDEAGLSELRRVIQRWKSETNREPHAFFGRMTPDEWDCLSLRHAELHLSFLIPEKKG